MGNDNVSPMKKVTGGGLPAVAWRDFMVSAHKKTPARRLPAPGDKPRRTTPADAPKEKKEGTFWKSILDIFGSPDR